MSDQLLTVLKFCLLALLYLFFFRVVRAVWAEITPPKPVRVPAGAPPGGSAPSRRPKPKSKPSTKPSKHPKLVVLEPANERGRAYPLGDVLSLGRSANCTVTVDDTFVSQEHARVFRMEGQYLVEDLGSTNGTYLNRKKVTGQMVMQRGDQLQVGNTVLELA